MSTSRDAASGVGAMKQNAFLVLGSLVSATAAPAGDMPDYVWSASAPLVNRATEALATGHAARAARLAEAAQRLSSHPADRLIAPP